MTVVYLESTNSNAEQNMIFPTIHHHVDITPIFSVNNTKPSTLYDWNKEI